MAGENLDEIRSSIDRLDAQLVELLRERASLAQAIGRLKGTDGQPFFTPERERQIYEKLGKAEVGPLRHEQVVAIFREVISAARAGSPAARADVRFDPPQPCFFLYAVGGREARFCRAAAL